MNVGNSGHLTYCTNIHPGETWPEVRTNLERYLLSVKGQMAPRGPFGVGLRLSAIAARALAEPRTLEEFKDFLLRNDLYVFTLNGFPYGPFHGEPVKENAYLPDWKQEDRLQYTNLLADLLVELLPDDPDLEGSISTVPGAFKPNADTPEKVAQITDVLLRHVAHLIQLRSRTGRTIGLALEPEPCCFLETVEETIAYFRSSLTSEAAVQRLMALTGLPSATAREALHRHIGVCLDLCHAAVEFEDAAGCLQQLRDANVRVHKMQLSSGLRVPGVDARTEELLRPFDDRVYLHQVVERNADGLNRYVDLADAFATLPGGRGEREWRVHCHVPVFLDDLGQFASTQNFIRDALAAHRARPVTAHLEAETYTWSVLPERYRGSSMDHAIARELSWLREHLG
jgi:sugar phosphate isomerase/epimerase